jgi:hypothetical protein
LHKEVNGDQIIFYPVSQSMLPIRGLTTWASRALLGALIGSI